MVSLEYLVKKGQDIRNGLKFVPPAYGVIRSFSVYNIEDHSAYTTWKNQAIIYLQNVLKDVDALKRFEEYDEFFENKHFNPSYLDNMIGILNAYLQSGIDKQDSFGQDNAQNNNNVFIVHGHNEAINQEMARTIEKLGLIAIILREQPNSGNTIIEKFEKNAEKSRFAVILLTADDKAPNKKEYRARQNVIFEMGYFMGKLGRKNVMCLLQDGVEKPGDIDGVVYTPIDTAGGWKFSLVQELKNCGYNVDANKLVE